jgi:hypothetical protein
MVFVQKYKEILHLNYTPSNILALLFNYSGGKLVTGVEGSLEDLHPPERSAFPRV